MGAIVHLSSHHLEASARTTPKKILFRESTLRLFALETSQECYLSDRCESHDDNLQWRWAWRRPIRSGRELEKFNGLMDLLCNFRHGTGEDGWNFLLSNSNLFSVKSVRVAIDKCGIVPTSGTNPHDYVSTNTGCWKSVVKAGMEVHNMGFHFFEALSRKECYLSDRCESHDDNLQWRWAWRRPIKSGRELEEFNGLMDLLCFRHGTGEDGWNFLLSNSNLFSVKSVRVAIDKCGIVSTSGTNPHDYVSTNTGCWISIVKAGMEVHNMGFHFFEALSRKECYLSDRCESHDDNLQWRWAWRRPIKSGRELEEFNGLMDLLCFRHGTGEDGWNFLLSNSNLFSVKSVRVAIDKCGIVSTSRPTRWSSLIPSKFLIFVWRAERNRIPTRVELDLKGIDIPSILCPICDNELETVDHILAKCDWVSHL
ncbi:RNA-directed DNA polymerase, eukaryota, Reverse transcriptase zinc-binding domain protein [Artemisia annua]|uniref:RNA-directed DNA polymerase, eukaryota, Reverse transcriptase zinc-binding domain protein n=1 Tax=Artemisia annua TaxID=35608 RepID=A0A2U1N6I5_ARTAN|nr:RNA-directed DNA polymerase, eukaryota, Reverse transcriptase zinc-binding domain protein [Artemisia annua]